MHFNDPIEEQRRSIWKVFRRKRPVTNTRADRANIQQPVITDGERRAGGGAPMEKWHGRQKKRKKRRARAIPVRMQSRRISLAVEERDVEHREEHPAPAEPRRRTATLRLAAGVHVNVPSVFFKQREATWEPGSE